MWQTIKISFDFGKNEEEKEVEKKVTIWEEKSIEYEEEYGIFAHKVIGKKMIYYANYPKYLDNPARTYKIVVNLEKMAEESRTLLSRYYRKLGYHNMYR